MSLARISAALSLAAAAITILPPVAAQPASVAAPLLPLADVLNRAMAAYQARDYQRAAIAFRSLADQGSAIAETMLGVIYARGQGVAPDPATAAGYWLRAASRGYAPAQLAFARALASGAGVTRDPEAAWVLASLAARGGDAAVAQQARGLAAQLQRGFTTERAAALAKQLASWRPWIAAY